VRVSRVLPLGKCLVQMVNMRKGQNAVVNSALCYSCFAGVRFIGAGDQVFATAENLNLILMHPRKMSSSLMQVCGQEWVSSS